MGVAICMIFAPAYGRGDEPTKEQLLAWFEAERQLAADPPPLGNVRLGYEMRQHASATPALLAEWKREVEGHPEHPRRRLIEVAERRLRDGPDISYGSIWRPSKERWRQNAEPSRPTPGVVTFGDRGQQGDRFWRLFEDAVVLDEAGSDGNRGEIAGLYNLLALFSHGGLYRGRSASVEAIEIVQDRWSIDASMENGWSWTHEGRWDGYLDLGIVNRVTEKPADDRPNRVWTFKEHVFDDNLSRWVCTHVDYRVGEGADQSRAEYLLTDVKEVEDRRLAAVLRVPAIGKEDAIRGVIAAGMEQDVGVGVVRRIDEAGRVTSTDRIAPPPPSSPMLRIVGLVAAVGIVGVLTWMRVRR